MVGLVDIVDVDVSSQVVYVGVEIHWLLYEVLFVVGGIVDLVVFVQHSLVGLGPYVVVGVAVIVVVFVGVFVGVEFVGAECGDVAWWLVAAVVVVVVVIEQQAEEWLG